MLTLNEDDDMAIKCHVRVDLKLIEILYFNNTDKKYWLSLSSLISSSLSLAISTIKR